jgi:hypothetical protein
MHEKLAALSVDGVRFDLAGIMRNVEQQRKLRAGKEALKNAPRTVAEDLVVGEGAVYRGSHRAEVAPADLALYRRTGEFAVGEANSRRLRSDHHALGVIGCDLVPEAVRAAVNGDDYVVLPKTEGRSGRLIENLCDDCASR